MLEDRDRERVRALRRSLQRIDTSSSRALDGLLPPLREALDTDRVLVYAVRPESPGWSFAFLQTLGFPLSDTRLIESIEPLFRSYHRFALFDPGRPEKTQRNEPVETPSWKSLVEEGLPAAIAGMPIPAAEKQERISLARRLSNAVLPWEVYTMHTARMLVCDGPDLLAWVGGYQPEAYHPRYFAVLRALLPALQQRLRLERRLGILGEPVDPLLDATLEHVAGPAFVTDLEGRLVTANTAGRQRYDADRSGTAALLRRPSQPPPGVRVSVNEVVTRGARGMRLVVVSEPAAPVIHRTRRAARHHGLTPRQTEVLQLLADGASNLRIAHTLGCAERTAEVHVAAVLAKFGCATRAAVIAQALTED